MNKIGIYYAYWAKKWDEKPDPYIKKASRLGFDILELNVSPLLQSSESRKGWIKQVANQEDIELTFSLGLPKEADPGARDVEVRREGIQFLKDSIDLVEDMGGQSLSGILYGAWGAPFGETSMDKEGYLQRSIDSLEEVLPKAEEQDIYLNLEVVNRFEHFLLNTCEEALDYLERINNPYCNILLDTYHMNIEEDNLGQAIKAAGDQLGHFHIGENNRKPPSRGGHLSWDQIFGALEKIDYDGPIVMEPFLVPGGDIARDIYLWRDLSEGIDLDKEARKSLTFVKNMLSKV